MTRVPPRGIMRERATATWRRRSLAAFGGDLAARIGTLLGGAAPQIGRYCRRSRRLPVRRRSAEARRLVGCHVHRAVNLGEVPCRRAAFRTAMARRPVGGSVRQAWRAAIAVATIAARVAVAAAALRAGSRVLDARAAPPQPVTPGDSSDRAGPPGLAARPTARRAQGGDQGRLRVHRPGGAARRTRASCRGSWSTRRSCGPATGTSRTTAATDCGRWCTSSRRWCCRRRSLASALLRASEAADGSSSRRTCPSNG